MSASPLRGWPVPNTDANEKTPPTLITPEANNGKGANPTEFSPVAPAGASGNAAGSLAPDYAASIDFLRRFHPSRRWTLTAIRPKASPDDQSKTVTETFTETNAARCQRWLEEQGGKGWNLYFSVGEVAMDVRKKAERGDILAVHYLHVDLDPRAGEDPDAEKARLLALLGNPTGGLPAPTYIVDSGGGVQGFWKLADPLAIDRSVEKADDARLYNKAIELALGGDNCHDISRIMRLPGTVNFPDFKKAAKGRVPKVARLLPSDTTSVYPLSRFAKARPVAANALASGSGATPKVTLSGTVKRIASVDELPAAVSDKAKRIIVGGHDPLGPDAPGTRRSEDLHFVCCDMARAGCDDDAIYGVITDPGFGISASVLEKGSMTERYARRQIERARDAVADFEKSDKGVLVPSQANVRRALLKLGISLSYNEFADKLLIAGLDGYAKPFLTDGVVKQLWLKIDSVFGFRPGFDFFTTVVEVVARENAFHPVRDYLASLTWDGTPRLDRWLTTYGGAEDSDFVRAAGALVLIAAVRRVRQPGCKFDEMLVLEGPQGTGKSSALEALAGNKDWFTDDLPLNADTKRQIEALAGRWIVEAGELKGMRKGDVESLKSFLSRQCDSARVAYGRIPNDYHRQCVIVGTTNSEKYLKDETGNRRFWPVRVAAFDRDALSRDRDQLWAEAAAREARGESIRLDPKLYGSAAAAQEVRLEDHPFYEALDAYLGDPAIVGKLPSEAVWCLLGKRSVGDRTQDDLTKLGAVMRRLGWERKRKRVGGKPSWCYARGDKAQQERLLAVTGSQDGYRVTVAEGEMVGGPF